MKTGNKMSKLVNNLKLHQLITKPTRLTSDSATLIDLLITNKEEMVLDSDVIPSPIGDHEAIIVTLNLRKPKKQPIVKTFRSLKNYSQERICNMVMNEIPNLNGILSTDNVSSQVKILTNVLNKCIDECAPIETKIISRPPKPWITDNIKEKIEVRDKLQNDIKQVHNNIDAVMLRNNFKEKKKEVKDDIDNSMKQHYRNELKNNKKNFSTSWKIVHSILTNNYHKESQIDNEDLTDKAEKFNEYFANVGRKTYERTQIELGRNNPNEQTNEPNIVTGNHLYSFKPSPVDCDTVILVISSLKDSNAYGSDGIPLRFIKDTLYMIVFYITVIVNTSIATNVYPEPWKNPHVVPYFKSGDRDEISNYRPISLLPVLSKILEKIIANQLSAYLESNNLISNSQHGFRPKLSTQTALSTISDKIFDNMDKKKISLLLLLDLSKAFDSVNHNILLNKCETLNVDPSWFKDYLHNRLQSVRLNNVVSSPMSVGFGVPQGSILGPILFNVYVNDLKNVLHDCFIVQYADDTQILIDDHIDNLEDLIQRAEEVLHRVKVYFQMNGLLLNEKKTQCIFLGSRQYISRIRDDIHIDFNGEVIKPMESVKNLGVHFDKYMTFDKHIDELHKKVMGTLIYLNRLKNYFEPETRLIVVQSLVLSLINYCFIVWGSTTNVCINRVQKLQNFAARVAIGTVRKHEHISPFLLILGWLKMKDKYTFDVCVLVFKVLRNLVPDWLYDFITADSITGITTRQANNLVPIRATTCMGSRRINTIGPQLWNSLPESLKDVESLEVFKNKLKKYLLIKT